MTPNQLTDVRLRSLEPSQEGRDRTRRSAPTPARFLIRTRLAGDRFYEVIEALDDLLLKLNGAVVT